MTSHAHWVKTAVKAVVVTWVAVAAYAAAVPAWVTATDRQLVHIMSGSMEPLLHTRHHALMKPITPERVTTLGVGDIITFDIGRPMPISHRIHAIKQTNQGRAFETKGDANGSTDPDLVLPGQVIGTVDGPMPLWMEPALALQVPTARLVLYGAPLLAVSLIQMLTLLGNVLHRQDPVGALRHS